MLDLLQRFMPNVMAIYQNVTWRMANQLEEYYPSEGV